MKPIQYISNSCLNECRFGFNGQEKDQEVYNNQSTTTAMFWEYDGRIGRRWNLDPIKKSWQSDYSCFSNSPIWKMDPNGDDDYYNIAGKYLGNDGRGTKIRLVDSRKEYNHFKANGVKALRAHSRIVKVDEGADKVLEDLYTNSVNDKIEHKAYIILNTKKATLTVKVQPQDPNDDAHNSTNFREGRKTDEGDKFIIPKGGSNNEVIVGQAHGHPGIPKAGFDIIPGISGNDANAAKTLNVPVYAIDKENIWKVDQNGNRESGQCKEEAAPKVIKDALETSGGKK
ncbi:MAG: hypothetical protein HXX18_06945 [Bacteroidetes bacterium]|nr:hypothetical protein [Bacteroidota bacterium]